MCVLNALINLLFAPVPPETTALQLNIFNKKKRHINENNVVKEALNLIEEDKRRKVHILQTISDYELNLTLTHKKQRMREYSRSSYLEVFLGKGVLKICSKFTGEHPCQSVNSINCTLAWVLPCI